MNLATWSLRNPVPSILLFVILSVCGAFAFRALPIKDLPEVDVPIFKVILVQPGASAVQLEAQVARPVEEALSVLRDVRGIDTTISEGVVTVRVEFRYNRVPFEALLEVREALDRVRSVLPADVQEPRIRRRNPVNSDPTVIYAVTSDTLSEEALTWAVSDTVLHAIQDVPGVDHVELAGGATREVEVEIEPANLDAFGLTVAEVSRAVKGAQLESSGGRARLGSQEQGIRILASVLRAEDLAALPVPLPGGQRIRLDQVATVRDTVADRVTSATLDGHATVGVQVHHAPGSDELALAAAVAGAVTDLAAAHPELHFTLVQSSEENITTNYHNALRMLFDGALLAVFVTWLFLRDWRPTLVGAVALPLSILPAFIVLWLAHFSLDMPSLLALSVVVGILVDDAIVEIENVARHLAPGRTVREATAQAVTEIGRAVIATTFALVVVFLPMSYLNGIAGKVFREFGWTAAAAVLSSLLVARLLTPLLCVWWLRPHAAVPEEGPLLRRYLALARAAVRVPAAAIGLGLLLVGLAGLLWLHLPTEFMPNFDTSTMPVNVTLPPGSTLEQTQAVTREVADAVAGGEHPLPAARHVYTTVGELAAVRAGAPGGAGEVRNAIVTVILPPYRDRPRSSVIETDLRERLAPVAGARLQVNGGGWGETINVNLVSRNVPALLAVSQALEAEMKELPSLSGVMSSITSERTAVTVTPDPVRTAALGVTAEAIAETVRIATSGDFNRELAKLHLEARQVDIRTRLAPSALESLEAIENLRVPGAHGLVPLSAVATVGLDTEPLALERVDRNRTIEIDADLRGVPLGAAMQQIGDLPALRSLPPDVTWVHQGEDRLMAELFEGFGRGLGLAALAVYCLLVVLFKDFFQPLTILSAAPLSASGALAGVWLIGGTVNLPVLIGFVMLLGLVAKNSILLVDYALNAERERGLPSAEAVLEACRVRSRPVLMTSLAMIAGMLPLVLRLHGGDLSFQRPMAGTIIGGLVSSTLLSLVVVPAVYVCVARLEHGLRRLTGLSRAATGSGP